MTNKWLLSIDSHNTAFSVVSVNNIFEFVESIKNSIDISRLQLNDEILVYRKEPIGAIQYRLVVENISGTIKFKKTHELVGLSKEKIIELFPSLNEILSKDLYFHEIEVNVFNELLKEFLGNKEDVPALEKTPYTEKQNKLPHNRIIFGAPGTGKSFMLEEQREEYFANRYRRVTFYPNYSYGQFFGTYKPTKEKLPSGESKITYEFVPGPFIKTLLDSLESKKNGTNENHLLIVEEINRANAPAVFGDVFQLLDRDESGVSEYPITLSEDAAEYIVEKHSSIDISNNEIRIPDNMYIWSTMNSADQGVQPLDSAFKRRFDFEYISINQGEQKIQGIQVSIPGFAYKVEWNLFRRTLNEFLVSEYTHLKEDKLIGPFFIKKNVLKNEKDFASAFINKLLMYLFEDVLKTANKEKLFTKRTFSEIVDLSSDPKEENRKVFTDLFYALLEKLTNENSKKTIDESKQIFVENHSNQSLNEDFEV